MRENNKKKGKSAESDPAVASNTIYTNPKILRQYCRELLFWTDFDQNLGYLKGQFHRF